VRIVLNPRLQHDFIEGEILVTGMTSPDFVPLMKKAAAVITELGGITCHAAIISRELNKPCVIGALGATQVLKDGEWVEVEAGKGLVKKLS
jgi:pyruvate,water dikinase